MKDEFSIVRRRFNQDEEREEYGLIRTCGSFRSACKIANSIDGLFGDIIFICDTAEVAEVSKISLLRYRSYDRAYHRCSPMFDKIATGIGTSAFMISDTLSFISSVRHPKSEQNLPNNSR